MGIYWLKVPNILLLMTVHIAKWRETTFCVGQSCLFAYVPHSFYSDHISYVNFVPVKMTCYIFSTGKVFYFLSTVHWCTDLSMCGTVHIRRFNVKLNSSRSQFHAWKETRITVQGVEDVTVMGNWFLINSTVLLLYTYFIDKYWYEFMSLSICRVI